MSASDFLVAWIVVAVLVITVPILTLWMLLAVYNATKKLSGSGKWWSDNGKPLLIACGAVLGFLALTFLITWLLVSYGLIVVEEV